MIDTFRKKLKRMFKSEHGNSVFDGGYNIKIAYVKSFNYLESKMKFKQGYEYTSYFNIVLVEKHVRPMFSCHM